jgi:hypothetical protein
MLADLEFGLVLLPAAVLAVLVATYVWSPNIEHRSRAREMMLVLLRHVPTGASASFSWNTDDWNTDDVDRPDSRQGRHTKQLSCTACNDDDALGSDHNRYPDIKIRND